MWKDQVRAIDDQRAQSDKVEVERARSVWLPPLPTEIPLQTHERGHRAVGVERRVDNHDAIEVIGSSRIGPGLGPPPARNSRHSQADTVEMAQGVFQQLPTCFIVTV